MWRTRPLVARLACALVLLCLGAAPALGQTIIQNGFEDGTTQGWGPRGSVSVTASTDIANSGAYSLKTTGRTATWNGPSLNVFPALSTGKTYQVTGYVRMVPGTASTATPQVKFTMQRLTNGTTSYDQVNNLTNITDTGWVRLQGTYSFPVGTTALSLYAESNDPSVGFYLDDFSIVELAGSGCPVPLDQTGFSSDFEDNTRQGWSSRGSETVAVTSADAHSGTYSLLTSNRTAAWNGPSHSAQCKMHNGSRYYVSVWAKLAPGEPDVQLRVSIQRTYAGTTNYNTVLGNKTVTANAWVHFEGNYTFAYDTTSLFIYVEAAGAVGDPPRHPSFYIDDFQLAYHPQPPIQPLPPLKDVLADYFPIGAAIDQTQTSGIQSQLLLRHYNSITAGNEMKISSIHPSENTYNFGPADTIANFARTHGYLLRGHTLLWHEQVPNWIFRKADGQTPLEPGVDRDLLLGRLKSHIDTVVGRYKDIVSSWDVVNEVIDANQPDGLRVTPWLQIIGPDYIDKAFEYARAAAGPTGKLYINDYSTTNPAKRQALLHVVEGLLARGVPVDGVGHQMHINIYQPSAAEIRTTLETFAHLGLENQITEMDMSVYADSSGNYATIPEDLLLLQGYRYKEVFDELRKLKNILNSVTIWGLGDDTSWLNRSRKDAPLPFDEDLQAKWAYWGIVDPSQMPVLIQNLEVHGGTPHVDANDDAVWDTVTPVTIPSDGPVSASFKALWDDTHVYLRVDVTDLTPDAGAIDVFIDQNNDKTTTYGTDDAHYVFDHFGTTQGSDLRGIMVPTQNGYRLEAAIPLQQAAAVGRKIGFDVRVRDGAQMLSWNDIKNHQDTDTSGFGVISLVSPVEASDTAHGTPVIDAVEDGIWDHAQEISTDKFVLGTSGSTARVKTLWDEGHLYVLAKVSDSLLSKASTNPWEQDSVEIFVDQNNAKTNSYEADDGQYRVNYENTQSFGGSASAAKFVTATRVVDGGYIVEAAIALDAIQPQAGMLIGFDVQVNNDGTGTGVRSSVATWNDESGRAYADPSRFGVLRLQLGSAAGPAR